jgi:hypothetical protein
LGEVEQRIAQDDHAVGVSCEHDGLAVQARRFVQLPAAGEHLRLHLASHRLGHHIVRAGELQALTRPFLGLVEAAKLVKRLCVPARSCREERALAGFLEDPAAFLRQLRRRGRVPGEQLCSRKVLRQVRSEREAVSPLLEHLAIFRLQCA